MIYVIKHVPEEGPGIFEELIPRDAVTLLAGSDTWPAVETNDIFLIMGGPMGVYERKRYPFIEKELQLIRRCREQGAKVFGVCLGAQMIAEALGGKVYKGHVQEIGWYRITHSTAAADDPVFSIFPKELDVFQWHGDTFDLPPGAINLAGSAHYPNQAFKVGRNIYGLQYHIEATEQILHEWFPDDAGGTLADTAKLYRLASLAVKSFKQFLKN